ncbi:PHP domain [Halobacillus dabanensis]|uniref:PHP domain n=1 Tax=Halobacillus dabanensis TaxID=240302 RepID=A0A1I3XVP6_HALDA|nr:AAA family ATPase [Halobacillus dabanensis]SFK23131.1 PHP domain [Halobacillus dabanensis]
MFQSGTEWIRADFHLHTKADKEFSYSGEEDRFVSDYVEKLKRENIKLGVITNHNKFDLSEYRGLKRKARKENITLLPGVELSVKEGANGIHCLIVFKDEDWINGKSETINQFLDEVFKGIENRENENTRCNKDLAGTIETLDSYNKDYFILMAHVEQKSGFLKECNGGLIESLSKQTWFKDKVLGFQKGRTRDKMNQLEEWMGYKLPFIEGSDCKTIEQIGKGKESYIKIGDGSFDSVILALKDHQNRTSLSQKEYNHGYIKSVELIGGKMHSQKINLSPELNSLIGIRGSGKSSIIEAIRYNLNMLPSTADEEYKTDVVKNLLESGGQVIIELQDNHGKNYKIKRILGEVPHILNEDGEEIGVTINSILQTPLYFGQKDLSYMKNGFELDLLSKLVGRKTKSFQGDLINKNDQLGKQISELFQLKDKVETLPDLRGNLRDVKHKIKIFEEKGLSEKLSKQVNFQKDERNIKNVYELVDKFKVELENLLTSNNLRDLNELSDQESSEVPELFVKLSKEVSSVVAVKKELQDIIGKIDSSSKQVKEYLEEIRGIISSLEEEFAEIKREIDIPNLNPDDFAKLKVNEDKLKKEIDQVTKQEENKGVIESQIRATLDDRNQLLLREFQVYKDEIEKINTNQNSLELSIEFKGNKKSFQDDLKQSFKGSKINQNTYQSISEAHSDFAALIVDVLLEESKVTSNLVTEAQLSKVKEIIKENYNELLKLRTPNKIEIKYHGKPIAKHSIGQRASALVLFILSQKDNNLIMIDQPEDDLDNQVIYNEIIRKVKERKPEVQFIFATHNANIPVLGDSEQVIAVSYDEKQISTETGSVDNKDIQTKIVDIMEGGQEAFNKRTQIYNLWKNE